MTRTRFVASVVFLLTLCGPLWSQSLPPVASAQLVAQFQAESGTIVTGPTSTVQSWTALNDSNIALGAMGGPATSITFDPAGMNGAGTVVFRSVFTQNAWLQGDLPAGVNLQDATVFWLGHYQTNPQTSGRYCYSIGTNAGSGSTQLTHESDDGQGGYEMQISTGQSTHSGDRIDHLENDYVVWRTEYFGGSPAVNHAAFADGLDLNVSGNSIGYDVGPDPHPVFLGSFQDDGLNFVGRVAELLIYDGILSPSDASAVEAYLQSREGGPIYTRYCSSTPNSSGAAALIHAAGSTSLGSNNLILSAQPVPIGVSGIFYYGLNEIQVPFGNGFRCVGGQTFRVQPTLLAMPHALLRSIDNTNLPPSGGFIAGGTFKFQAWYRDPSGGGQQFDLSDGLSITFTP